MAQFIAPTKLAGKTIQEALSESGAYGRADILAQQLGIDPSQRFQEGQTFNVSQFDPGSAEGQFLQSQFTMGQDPVSSAVGGDQQQFLESFRTQYGDIVSGLQEQLQLPELQEFALQAGQQLEELPGVYEEFARGQDISANQLARLTAAKTAELAPIAQKAIEQAQFAQEQFGQRLGQELVPLQTELQLYQDQLAREFTQYTQQQQNELDVLLQKMQLEGQLSMAEQQRAHELAMLEAQTEEVKQQGQLVNLGDRMALINPVTGQEISSFAVGLQPARQAATGVSTGDLGTLATSIFGF